MRLATLLVLLALGLPTVALASGIDYSTGKFEKGTFSGSFTTGIVATEVGSLNTITIDTGTLTQLPKSDCSKGFTCYDFSGGSVTVKHDGTTVFTDSLKGGVLKENDEGADITATLLPDGKVSQGTAVATLGFGNPHRRGRSEGNHTEHDGQGQGSEDHSGRDRHRRGRFEQHLDAGSTNVTLAAATTPEPGTLGLLGTGLIGLAGLARRTRKRGI